MQNRVDQQPQNSQNGFAKSPRLLAIEQQKSPIKVINLNGRNIDMEMIKIVSGKEAVKRISKEIWEFIEGKELLIDQTLKFKVRDAVAVGEEKLKKLFEDVLKCLNSNANGGGENAGVKGGENADVQNTKGKKGKKSKETKETSSEKTSNITWKPEHYTLILSYLDMEQDSRNKNWLHDAFLEFKEEYSSDFGSLSYEQFKTRFSNAKSRLETWYKTYSSYVITPPTGNQPEPTETWFTFFNVQENRNAAVNLWAKHDGMKDVELFDEVITK